MSCFFCSKSQEMLKLMITAISILIHVFYLIKYQLYHINMFLYEKHTFILKK